jgi:hypothetical protein
MHRDILDTVTGFRPELGNQLGRYMAVAALSDDALVVAEMRRPFPPLVSHDFHFMAENTERCFRGGFDKKHAADENDSRTAGSGGKKNGGSCLDFDFHKTLIPLFSGDAETSSA